MGNKTAYFVSILGNLEASKFTRTFFPEWRENKVISTVVSALDTMMYPYFGGGESMRSFSAIRIQFIFGLFPIYMKRHTRFLYACWSDPRFISRSSQSNHFHLVSSRKKNQDRNPCMLSNVLTAKAHIGRILYCPRVFWILLFAIWFDFSITYSCIYSACFLLVTAKCAIADWIGFCAASFVSAAPLATASVMRSNG